LDLQKHRWIVKGRFRDALQFQHSVAQFWQKTEFGPTLTIFLESDPEVASAIPPSFLSHRSTSLSKSRSRSSHSPSISSIAVYFSVPRVIHRTPHGLMDSMDLVIKINKLKKRINGVHGLSMDSMDSKGLVSTFKKDTWSPWTFYGLHGL